MKYPSLEFTAIQNSQKMRSETEILIRFKTKSKWLHLDRETVVLKEGNVPSLGDTIKFNFKHVHERNYQRNMLLTKIYFFTSSPAQPCGSLEYKLAFTSIKYHYVFDLYKLTKKANHSVTGHA